MKVKRKIVSAAASLKGACVGGVTHMGFQLP